jgi:selenocysteine lyase/cysteine desulfurase
VTVKELRALFPSAGKCIYLNHAGTSPIAAPVAEAVQAVCVELMSENGLIAYTNDLKRQQALRVALGRMMNVAPTTLGYVRNTSHGIAVAAQAIPFRPGDTVVLPAIEYPANVYPWMAQAHRGVTVRLIPPREDDLVEEDDLIAACDTSTRVLAMSWVQWGTGQRLDMARLGAFCRERGILLVADVVQGLGALRLDLSALPVDIATAGCHKWLLAPGGVGVLYVRPEVFPTLLPTNIGWNSVEKPFDWERLHYDDLKPTPDRFEEGTSSILAIAALRKSVELLEAVGFDAVNDRVLALADHARERVAARGMRLFSPSAPGTRSGIVAFRHPRRPNKEILDILAAANVIAAVRGGNVRFAPHAYNSVADIDTAVAAIPD